MYDTDKQLFYINSYFRTKQEDSTSDFSFILDVDPLQEYNRVSIIDASIPKSNYSITTNNNTFTVEEEAGTRTITIPVGNYSRRGFRAC